MVTMAPWSKETRAEALRWLGFVTAIWVQAIAGNNYTFSNYSVALKSIMGLNQVELNNLSVAKDVGKAFGLLAGFASDYVPAWAIFAIGSVEGLVGYGAQWLVVSRRISPLPYWQMCIYLCMGGNSTTWMNTAVLVTCMRNFSRNRGPVVGILKGYIGLSTAIFTDLCAALFSGSSASFLVMLALVPAAVCVTAMLFLHPVPAAAAADDDGAESANFSVFNAIAVVVAVYLLAFDVTGHHGVLFSRVFAAGLLLLLAAPLVVPMKVLLGGRRTVVRDVEKQPLTQPLVQQEERENKEGVKKELEDRKEVDVESVENCRKPMLGEDHTIFQAIQNVDFWLLFVAFLCGVGTGMAVMNNMGQIGLALGYTDVSMFVSLISIWGFFGRIGAGTVSEHFLRKAGVPRPVWMAASQVLMLVGYLLMAVAIPGSLYLGSIVVGICYGVRISVSVPTSSELFGLKYYGIIYNVLILNLPLGSLLFSGLLAGILYDMEAEKSNSRPPLRHTLMKFLSIASNNSSSNNCVGAHCYRMVFLVMAAVCLLGLGLDVLLSYRTRALYRSIYESRKGGKKRDSVKAPASS